MEINQRKTYTPAELIVETLRAYLDYYNIDRKQEFRQLTCREQVEQSIAAMKLIVYGSAAVGLTFDRLLTQR